MKTVWMTVLALGFATMMAGSAVAADTPPATFGVIDMSKVMSTSDVSRDIYAQMERKTKEFQGALVKEEQALRTAEQALMKEKDKLSKEELDKKRQAFEKQVASWQKNRAERKRTLDRGLSVALDRLRAEAASAVAGIAKERNYAAVFTQDAVMISRPELDMTDAVIAQLNKKIKKLPIDWAAAEGKKKK